MKAVFDLRGMSREDEASAVRRAVVAVRGVSDADVRYASSDMTVGFDAIRTDEEAICAAVSRLGFSVTVREAPRSAAERARRKAIRRELYCYRRRAVLSFALLLPLLCVSLSDTVGLPLLWWLEPPSILYGLTQAILSFAVCVVNIRVFTRGFRGLFTLSPNADSLTALTSAAAFGVSVYFAATGDASRLCFGICALAPAISSLGGYLEVRARRAVNGKVTDMLDLSDGSAVPESAEKPSRPRAADKLGKAGVICALCAAVITGVVWAVISHSAGKALIYAASALAACCPAVFGAAAPAAVLASSASAAKKGLLFRNAASLENACECDTVLYGDADGAYVKSLAAAGKRVLAAGEDMNDLPLLDAAEIGVAGGAIPADSSDVAVAGSVKAAVPELIASSRRALSGIRLSLILSCVFNILCVIPACGALGSAGIAVTPAAAAGAALLSAVCVCVNAARLRK